MLLVLFSLFSCASCRWAGDVSCRLPPRPGGPLFLPLVPSVFSCVVALACAARRLFSSLLVVLVPADSDGEAPGISELAPPRLRLFLNTYDSTGAAIFQPARSLFFKEGVENTPARSCLWSFFSLRAHTSRFHQNVQHMFS